MSSYEKDIYGNEIYEKIADNIVIFHQIGIEQKYARDRDGNEYYPDTDQIAHADGLPLYALDKDNKVIFKKDGDGNEFYLKTEDESSVVQSVAGNIRYARLANGREIYPTVKSEMGFFEVVISQTSYAKDEHGVPYYPVDEYGNEMLDPVLGELDDYPVTNDGYIIVPSRNDKPYFLPNVRRVVTESDIVGYLFRSNGIPDFITGIKSDREKRTYYSVPFNTNYTILMNMGKDDNDDDDEGQDGILEGGRKKKMKTLVINQQQQQHYLIKKIQ